jgi:hypothetical protein
MVVAKGLYRLVRIEIKIIVMILWFIHKIWTLNAGCVDTATIGKIILMQNITHLNLYFLLYLEIHSFTGAYSPGRIFGLPFGVSWSLYLEIMTNLIAIHILIKLEWLPELISKHIVCWFLPPCMIMLVKWSNTIHDCLCTIDLVQVD